MPSAYPASSFAPAVNELSTAAEGQPILSRIANACELRIREWSAAGILSGISWGGIVAIATGPFVLGCFYGSYRAYKEMRETVEATVRMVEKLDPPIANLRDATDEVKRFWDEVKAMRREVEASRRGVDGPGGGRIGRRV